MELIHRVLAGDRRALARLISLVENNASQAVEALRQLHPRTGRAYILGITGPPGAGKSTLVKHLARVFRAKGMTVAVVAIDPSSPFTGGAFLGDRVRMQELSEDEGIFVRSMATRGALGGLARATSDVVSLLDAFGYELIIIETVGAGQTEVEVTHAAQTTVVVGMPGTGDDIQAFKAGLLEIADIYVVNKADREGAEQLAAEVRAAFSLSPDRGWQVPILLTVATQNQGIDALVEALERHRVYLQDTGEIERKRLAAARRQILSLAREQVLGRLLERDGAKELERLVEAVMARRLDPYTAAEQLAGLSLGAKLGG